MIYTELTCKAMMTAYNAHHGQLDVNGVPYIFHPYHVAEQMKDEITVCVALLHDVVEDTGVTMDELAAEFPDEVIGALKLLTHEPGTDYYEYVKRICTNPVARAVKMGDMLHNMDETRIYDKSRVSEERLKHWREKYARAMKILEGSPVEI